MRGMHGDTALLLAVKNGQHQTVDALVRNGAKVNEKNKHGDTALLLAASNGHLETVQYLLEKGAKVNERDKHGNTALLLAAKNGHQQTVYALLSKGTRVDERNDNGDTALLLAAKNGHGLIVNDLLCKGAKVDEKDNNGNTALLLAASNGHLETMQYLLEKSAKVNERDKYGNTALLLAAKNGHQQTVYDLLSKGTKVGERNENGDTALLLAAKNGHGLIVNDLLCKGAKVDEKDNNGNTALLLAVSNGHLETMQYLLEKGAKLDGRDNNGNTALLLAASNGDLKAMQYLLEKGAKIDERDNNGNTALLLAAKKGRAQTVECLLNKGAKLDEKDNNGNTALLLAASNGDLKAMQYLLEKGAKIDERDNNGNTALLLAEKNGYETLGQWLAKKTDKASFLLAAETGDFVLIKKLLQKWEQSGLNLLAVKDKNGYTPLLLAIKNSHQPIITFLLDRSAEGEEKCAKGLTALYTAITVGDIDVVRYLLGKGAMVNVVDDEGVALLVKAIDIAGDKNTAVHWAIVDVLIEGGATCSDYNSNTIIKLICVAGHHKQWSLVLWLANEGQPYNYHETLPLTLVSRFTESPEVLSLLSLAFKHEGIFTYTPAQTEVTANPEAVNPVRLNPYAKTFFCTSITGVAQESRHIRFTLSDNQKIDEPASSYFTSFLNRRTISQGVMNSPPKDIKEYHSIDHIFLEYINDPVVVQRLLQWGFTPSPVVLDAALYHDEQAVLKPLSEYRLPVCRESLCLALRTQKVDLAKCLLNAGIAPYETYETDKDIFSYTILQRDNKLRMPLLFQAFEQKNIELVSLFLGEHSVYVHEYRALQDYYVHALHCGEKETCEHILPYILEAEYYFLYKKEDTLDALKTEQLLPFNSNDNGFSENITQLHQQWQSPLTEKKHLLPLLTACWVGLFVDAPDELNVSTNCLIEKLKLILARSTTGKLGRLQIDILFITEIISYASNSDNLNHKAFFAYWLPLIAERLVYHQYQFKKLIALYEFALNHKKITEKMNMASFTKILALLDGCIAAIEGKTDVTLASYLMALKQAISFLGQQGVVFDKLSALLLNEMTLCFSQTAQLTQKAWDKEYKPQQLEKPFLDIASLEPLSETLGDLMIASEHQSLATTVQLTAKFIVEANDHFNEVSQLSGQVEAYKPMAMLAGKCEGFWGGVAKLVGAGPSSHCETLEAVGKGLDGIGEGLDKGFDAMEECVKGIADMSEKCFNQLHQRINELDSMAEKATEQLSKRLAYLNQVIYQRTEQVKKNLQSLHLSSSQKFSQIHGLLAVTKYKNETLLKMTKQLAGRTDQQFFELMGDRYTKLSDRINHLAFLFSSSNTTYQRRALKYLETTYLLTTELCSQATVAGPRKAPRKAYLLWEAIETRGLACNINMLAAYAMQAQVGLPALQSPLVNIELWYQGIEMYQRVLLLPETNFSKAQLIHQIDEIKNCGVAYLQFIANLGQCFALFHYLQTSYLRSLEHLYAQLLSHSSDEHSVSLTDAERDVNAALGVWFSYLMLAFPKQFSVGETLAMSLAGLPNAANFKVCYQQSAKSDHARLLHSVLQQSMLVMKVIKTLATHPEERAALCDWVAEGMVSLDRLAYLQRLEHAFNFNQLDIKPEAPAGIAYCLAHAEHRPENLLNHDKLHFMPLLLKKEMLIASKNEQADLSVFFAVLKDDALYQLGAAQALSQIIKFSDAKSSQRYYQGQLLRVLNNPPEYRGFDEMGNLEQQGFREACASILSECKGKYSNKFDSNCIVINKLKELVTHTTETQDIDFLNNLIANESLMGHGGGSWLLTHIREVTSKDFAWVTVAVAVARYRQKYLNNMRKDIPLITGHAFEHSPGYNSFSFTWRGDIGTRQLLLASGYCMLLNGYGLPMYLNNNVKNCLSSDAYFFNKSKNYSRNTGSFSFYDNLLNKYTYILHFAISTGDFYLLRGLFEKGLANIYHFHNEDNVSFNQLRSTFLNRYDEKGYMPIHYLAFLLKYDQAKQSAGPVQLDLQGWYFDGHCKKRDVANTSETKQQVIRLFLRYMLDQGADIQALTKGSKDIIQLCSEQNLDIMPVVVDLLLSRHKGITAFDYVNLLPGDSILSSYWLSDSLLRWFPLLGDNYQHEEASDGSMVLPTTHSKKLMRQALQTSLRAAHQKSAYMTAMDIDMAIVEQLPQVQNQFLFLKENFQQSQALLSLCKNAKTVLKQFKQEGKALTEIKAMQLLLQGAEQEDTEAYQLFSAFLLMNNQSGNMPSRRTINILLLEAFGLKNTVCFTLYSELKKLNNKAIESHCASRANFMSWMLDALKIAESDKKAYRDIVMPFHHLAKNGKIPKQAACDLLLTHAEKVWPEVMSYHHKAVKLFEKLQASEKMSTDSGLLHDTLSSELGLCSDEDDTFFITLVMSSVYRKKVDTKESLLEIIDKYNRKESGFQSAYIKFVNMLETTQSSKLNSEEIATLLLKCFNAEDSLLHNFYKVLNSIAYVLIAFVFSGHQIKESDFLGLPKDYWVNVILLLMGVDRLPDCEAYQQLMQAMKEWPEEGIEENVVFQCAFNLLNLMHTPVWDLHQRFQQLPADVDIYQAITAYNSNLLRTDYLLKLMDFEKADWYPSYQKAIFYSQKWWDIRKHVLKNKSNQETTATKSLLSFSFIFESRSPSKPVLSDLENFCKTLFETLIKENSLLKQVHRQAQQIVLSIAALNNLKLTSDNAIEYLLNLEGQFAKEAGLNIEKRIDNSAQLVSSVLEGDFSTVFQPSTFSSQQHKVDALSLKINDMPERSIPSYTQIIDNAFVSNFSAFAPSKLPGLSMPSLNLSKPTNFADIKIEPAKINIDATTFNFPQINTRLKDSFSIEVKNFNFNGMVNNLLKSHGNNAQDLVRKTNAKVSQFSNFIPSTTRTARNLRGFQSFLNDMDKGLSSENLFNAALDIDNWKKGIDIAQKMPDFVNDLSKNLFDGMKGMIEDAMKDIMDAFKFDASNFGEKAGALVDVAGFMMNTFGVPPRINEGIMDIAKGAVTIANSIICYSSMCASMGPVGLTLAIGTAVVQITRGILKLCGFGGPSEAEMTESVMKQFTVLGKHIQARFEQLGNMLVEVQKGMLEGFESTDKHLINFGQRLQEHFEHLNNQVDTITKNTQKAFGQIDDMLLKLHQEISVQLAHIVGSLSDSNLQTDTLLERLGAFDERLNNLVLDIKKYDYELLNQRILQLRHMRDISDEAYGYRIKKYRLDIMSWVENHIDALILSNDPTSFVDAQHLWSTLSTSDIQSHINLLPQFLITIKSSEFKDWESLKLLNKLPNPELWCCCVSLYRNLLLSARGTVLWDINEDLAILYKQGEKLQQFFKFISINKIAIIKALIKQYNDNLSHALRAISRGVKLSSSHKTHDLLDKIDTFKHLLQLFLHWLLPLRVMLEPNFSALLKEKLWSGKDIEAFWNYEHFVATNGSVFIAAIKRLACEAIADVEVYALKQLLLTQDYVIDFGVERYFLEIYSLDSLYGQQSLPENDVINLRIVEELKTKSLTSVPLEASIDKKGIKDASVFLPKERAKEGKKPAEKLTVDLLDKKILNSSVDNSQKTEESSTHGTVIKIDNEVIQRINVKTWLRDDNIKGLHKTEEDKITWKQQVKLLMQVEKRLSLSAEQINSLKVYFKFCRDEFVDKSQNNNVFSRALRFTQDALNLIETSEISNVIRQEMPKTELTRLPTFQ